jgi:hypothetical protein
MKRLFTLTALTLAGALVACATAPESGASLSNNCRVFAAHSSIDMNASAAKRSNANVSQGENARAAATLERLRGHGMATSSTIDDLLRECR